MSTDSSDSAIEPVEQQPTTASETACDATCPACGSELARGSLHDYGAWRARCYTCPECGLGSAVLVDVDDVEDLTDRVESRLADTRERATNGLTAFRIAAFCTPKYGAGQYRVERVDEHTYSVDLPEGASPWDVLRLGEMLSIGPLAAERGTGWLIVQDTRWVSGAAGEGIVATDGGAQARMVDGEVTDPESDPFAVREDDDDRTKRAKTEDMDVALQSAPGVYRVHSESGSTYEVDVLEEECSCPDRVERCKHLRRVDLEIEVEQVPRPDGRVP